MTKFFLEIYSEVVLYIIRINKGIMHVRDPSSVNTC